MRLTLVFLLALFALAPAVRADELAYTWNDTLNPEKVDRLLAGFMRRAKESPADFEAREKAALLSFYAWRLEKQDNARRLQLAKLTVKFGKEMVDLRPDQAPGYHWVGAGMGMVGLTRGVLNSLQLVPQIKIHLEKSAALDPAYIDGNALATLGRVYTVLPSFPLSIGDKEKALQLLIKARKAGPGFTLTQLFLADLLWALGRNDEAVAELEKIAANKPKTEQQFFLYETNKKKAAEVIELIRSGAPRDPFFDVLSDIQPGLVD